MNFKRNLYIGASLAAFAVAFWKDQRGEVTIPALTSQISDIRDKMRAIMTRVDEELEGLMPDELGAEFDDLSKKAQDLFDKREAMIQDRERRRALDGLEIVDRGDGYMRNVTSAELDPAITGGFKSLSEMAQAVYRVRNHGMDERLGNLQRAQPTNFHEGGGGSGEAFMLPTMFRDQIWEVVDSVQDLTTRVDMEPTSARQVKMIKDESTPWGGTGVQARWRAEGTQMTADKLTTEGETLELHELYAFVLATGELLDDGPRLRDRLTRKAGLAISWKRSDTIVNGDGVGKPRGWFAAANPGVSVAKEGGQSADTIQVENLSKMYARLLVSDGDSPFWLANRDIVPQLVTLTIGNQPVWTGFNGGMREAPSGVLMGYPILFSESARTLGDKGDIQLVNGMGYYAARRTADPDFASSIHLFFDYNIEAFRWMFRMAGQPHLSAPVSPNYGAATKSHFVFLDERA